LERYEAVKQAASSAYTANDNHHNAILLQHIQAQAMYHLQDYRGAEEVYSNLLQLEGELDAEISETIQFLNNLVAIPCANMIPFTRTEDALAPYQSQLATLLDENNNDSEQEYPSDLAYNLATYDLCTAGHARSTADMGNSC
jgi:hypothetical protein